MKAGIIRCMQTEDYCPGTTDFRMIREKKGAFEGIDEDVYKRQLAGSRRRFIKAQLINLISVGG